MSVWSIVPSSMDGGAKQQALAARLAKSVGLSESTVNSDLSRIKGGDPAKVRLYFLDHPDRGKALCEALGLPGQLGEVMLEARKLQDQADVWIVANPAEAAEVAPLRSLLETIQRKASVSSEGVAIVGVCLDQPLDEYKAGVAEQLKRLGCPITSDPDKLAGSHAVISLGSQRKGLTIDLRANLQANGWSFSPRHQELKLFPRSPGAWLQGWEDRLAEAYPGEPLVECPVNLPSPYRAVNCDAKMKDALVRAEQALLAGGHEDASAVWQETVRPLWPRKSNDYYYDRDRDADRGPVPRMENMGDLDALIYAVLIGEVPSGKLPRCVALAVSENGFGLSPDGHGQGVQTLGALSKLGSEYGRLSELPELPESGALHGEARKEDPYYSRRNGEKPILLYNRRQRTITHGRKNQDTDYIELALDWVGANTRLSEALFVSGDTGGGWEPQYVELGTGRAVARIGSKIVVYAGAEVTEAMRKVDNQSGLESVSLEVALKRAVDSVDRWAGRIWSSADEWPERKALWSERRPRDLADDATDEVARILLEGIYAQWRPSYAPLAKRMVDDSGWILDANQCFTEVKPWLDALATAPLRCQVPEAIAVVIDAIKHGGNWMVRPSPYVNAWACTLQTVGGQLFELLLWKAPHGSKPPARCVYLTYDQYHRGEVTVEGMALETNRTFELHVLDPERALTWTFVRSGGLPFIADFAVGDYRFRLLSIASAPPSGAAGSSTAGTAGLLQRREQAEEAARRARSSYEDDYDD